MANVLGPGESLRPGQSLFSTNMAYELRLQGDGNMVLYRVADWKPLWWSKTEGRLISALTMQLDGNLVIYRQGPSAWSTGTPQ
jgi:hypothetical protein